MYLFKIFKLLFRKVKPEKSKVEKVSSNVEVESSPEASNLETPEKKESNISVEEQGKLQRNRVKSCNQPV